MSYRIKNIEYEKYEDLKDFVVDKLKELGLSKYLPNKANT